MIVPQQNAHEAAVVNNLKVYGAGNIKEVIEFFNGTQELTPTLVNTREEFYSQQSNFDFDFAEVKGQENVKRALEVAASGSHNILLIGSPGSGKSMLAKRLPSILPPLSLGESLETTKIHSVAGKLGKDGGLISKRPFRAPHHTISTVAMTGGGSFPQPVKSVWHITAFYILMNCQSTAATYWRFFANRWKIGRLPCHASDAM